MNDASSAMYCITSIAVHISMSFVGGRFLSANQPFVAFVVVVKLPHTLASFPCVTG